MASKRGKFIVIEGGDSSGKEVQSKLLAKYLKRKGFKIKFFDFPKYYGFFGKIVGRYLSGEFGDVKDIHPVLTVMPFALDRFLSRSEISDFLAKGYYIVCNRYVGSALAYMSAKLPVKGRQKYIGWNEKLEYKQLKLPVEDVAIFLYVDPKLGQELTYAKDEKVYMKGKGRGDIHERNLKYLKEVSKQYFWLVKNRKRYAIVRCMKGPSGLRPVDDIHRDILKVLAKRRIIKTPSGI